MNKNETQLCRFSWLGTWLLGLLIIQISGCASVPEGSAAMKHQALSFTPPPGMAGLYVIREWHMLGAANLTNVRLDYQEFGSLKTSSYVYSPILPGKHFLRMGGKGESTDHGLATFVAEPGKNYYYSVHFSLDILTSPLDRIHLI